MECLHRFCRDCIDKSMRLGYGAICYCLICLVPVSFLKKWSPNLVAVSNPENTL
jgi:hypothetical protein